MNVSRSTKIIFGSLGVFIGTVIVLLIVLLNFDWNRARPWINNRVSEAIDRPFAIEGPLALSWQRAPGDMSSWTRWVPWPRLVAKDIRVGNPSTAAAADMAREHMAEIAQLTFSLNPLPLLQHTISIPLLQLDSPHITLQRTAAGENNWTFAKSAKSRWQLDLQAIGLKDGTVRIVDAIRQADVTATLNTMETDTPEGYRIAWSAQGTVAKQAVKGSGKAGGVLALQAQTSPFPVEGQLSSGKTTISVKGSLTRPRELTALDMRLKLSGASAAHLYRLTGINLPETPAFSTEGRLHGRFEPQGAHWTYERFTGKVGGSDITGTLDYTDRKPRGMLKGTVVSKLLRIEDLAPLIGADSNASKAQRGETAMQPPDKVLPVARFKTERWTSLDADVRFTGEKIIHKPELPVDHLQTHLTMQAGVLKLTPLNFGVAGGTIRSEITLDGRQPKIKANMTVAGRKLNLSRLFPTLEPMEASIGHLNTNSSLSATGESIAELMGNANGEVKALVDQGTISKLLLEKIGLNLGNVVLTTLLGDKQVKLNCVAGDFAVIKGVMHTRSLIVDTEESNLHIDGTVDLAAERLNLVITPRVKGMRIITLRTPLYVVGPFKAPKVTVDTARVAMKAGAAALLAAAAPLAALLPLANLGEDEMNKCAELLNAARAKPVAPPPGKTAGARAR